LLATVLGAGAAETGILVAEVHAEKISAQLAIPQRIEVRRCRMSWFEYARRGLFLPNVFRAVRTRRSKFSR
jgi:hypothetical protein